jgi:hypothetical protein
MPVITTVKNRLVKNKDVLPTDIDIVLIMLRLLSNITFQRIHVVLILIEDLTFLLPFR